MCVEIFHRGPAPITLGWLHGTGGLPVKEVLEGLCVGNFIVEDGDLNEKAKKLGVLQPWEVYMDGLWLVSNASCGCVA